MTGEMLGSALGAYVHFLMRVLINTGPPCRRERERERRLPYLPVIANPDPPQAVASGLLLTLSVQVAWIQIVPGSGTASVPTGLGVPLPM